MKTAIFPTFFLITVSVFISMAGCTTSNETTKKRPANINHEKTESIEDSITKAEIVNELIQTMKLPSVHRQTTEIMIQTIVDGNPEMSPFIDVFQSFMDQYMSWNHFEEDYAKLYSESFTKSELKDLIQFFNTNSGQKYINKSPELFRKSLLIEQERMNEHLPILEQMIMEYAQQSEEKYYPEDGLFSFIEGRWEREDEEQSCAENSYVITSKPDQKQFIIEYDRRPDVPGEDNQNMYQYNVIEINPEYMRAVIEGETRKTDHGETVEWDLVPLSENEFCWRRSDWEISSCTQSVKRCN